ncbi:MAG: hypothetical protein JXA03_06210 [Bacteroidales bacterium]|nr:hypothetical protein [Bacteroidales bacterium]
MSNNFTIKNIMDFTNLLQYQLIISNPLNSPFPGAFLIMKTAYDTNVKGECRYFSQKSYSILVEGEKGNLSTFLNKIKTVLPEFEVTIQGVKEISSFHFREFDILEQFNKSQTCNS